MERFIENEEEQELVDLFDKEDQRAEEIHHKRVMASAGLLGKRLNTEEEGEKPSKRQKVAEDSLEHHYLERLPSADMYERSYMHKDIVCQSKIQTHYI